MKLKILLFSVFIGINIINAQNVKKEYLEYDYFAHSYKYLDEDFSISIPDTVFQKLMVDFRFYPERIKTYKDSLAVVLCGEFDNWDQNRIAGLRITFSWLRAGYYLWMTADEAQEIAQNYSFDHPYQFYQYFRYGEKFWDRRMKKIMRNLRNEVATITNDPNIYDLTNREFLKFSLVNNPVRIKDYAEYKKCNGKGCERGEDCCQKTITIDNQENR